MTFCLELHILVYLLKWPCSLPQTLLFSLNANTKMIALQCCVDFCHTSSWVSHRFTHVLSLLPPATPSHPSRLSQNTGLNSLCHTANSHWLSILPVVMYVSDFRNVCFNTTLSTRPTLSFPRCALCLYLYYCPTNTNRFIGTIFLDTIFVFIYIICFSLSDLLHSV